VLYMVAIFGLQYLMRNQKPQSLHWPMMLHNAFLLLISLAMCVGTVVEALLALSRGNHIFDLFCDPKADFARGPIWFWTYIYYLSKFYEFLDTFFIVMKKKPVIFLHLYHHAVVVVVCWLGMQNLHTNQWFAVTLNTGIHVVMYSYYIMAANGYQPWWKKYLTTIQMIQFCMVMTLLGYWAYVTTNQPEGARCSGPVWSASVCALMNLTLLALFYNFYRSTYKKKDA